MPGIQPFTRALPPAPLAPGWTRAKITIEPRRATSRWFRWRQALLGLGGWLAFALLVVMAWLIGGPDPLRTYFTGSAWQGGYGWGVLVVILAFATALLVRPSEEVVIEPSGVRHRMLLRTLRVQLADVAAILVREALTEGPGGVPLHRYHVALAFGKRGPVRDAIAWATMPWFAVPQAERAADVAAQLQAVMTRLGRTVPIQWQDLLGAPAPRPRGHGAPR